MASTRKWDQSDDDDDDLDAWNEEEENARKFDPDEDEADTYNCPYCKAEVYEGVDVCPKCGSFVTFEDLAGADSKRSKWFMVAAILLIAVFGGVVGAMTWLLH